MSTEIVCTACGELFAVEGDSVSLPFVCLACWQKQEELTKDAETAQLAADAEAQTLAETEQPDNGGDIVHDGLMTALFSLSATAGDMAKELKTAHEFEEKSHKTVAHLLETLDVVTAERDFAQDAATHNANTGLEIYEALVESQEKVGKLSTDIEFIMMQHRAASAAGDETLQLLRKMYQDRSNELHSTQSLLKITKDNLRRVDMLWSESNARNAGYVQEIDRLTTPWYKKVYRWWNTESLPDVSIWF